MTIDRRSVLLTGAAGAAAIIAAPVARVMADGHGMTVEMLSKHPENKKLRNVFLPRVLVVQPGDTVVFAPTDKGHNSASVEGMLPEGAEEWKGGINKEIAITFDKPGFYGYQCTPHASLGMVGLVVVQGDGMMDNFEDAKGVRQRGKAKKIWKEIWEEVEEQGLTA